MPEVYVPEKIGSGELVDALIRLGNNAEISVGDETTSGFSLRREAWKGWYEGREVFSLTNQGLKVTGDINATSGVFSGTISIGSADSIFLATEEGISLGADQWGNAPFRVTPRGDLFATSASISGEYKSANAGERFVINTGGVNPDEIRFYPNTGNNYGSIYSQAPFPDVAELITKVKGPEGTAAVSTINVNYDNVTTKYEAFAEGNPLWQVSRTKVGPGFAGINAHSDATLSFPPADASIGLYVSPAAYGYSRINLAAEDIVMGSSIPGGAGIGESPVARLKLSATYGVGFNGAGGILKRTVDAAATDLPTAIALLNQVRTWGIDIGFLQV